MSGFGVAGLVLGAFPIAKSWWQFETTFETFISAIGAQEIAYTQVLKRLLDPLDISDCEYESLLKDPKSALWNECHIREGIRQQLSETEYHWVMRSLVDLNEATRELQTLLPINKVNSTGLESELRKDRLLKRITSTNDALHHFLDRASGLTRQSSPNPKAAFGDMQSQAITFYECLAKQWRCCCQTAHTVGITTQPALRSSHGSSGYFSVLFEHETERKQLNIQLERVISADPSSANTHAPPRIDTEAAGNLNDQMWLKKQHKLAVNASTIASLSIASPSSSKPRTTNKLQKWSSQRSADQLPTSSQLTSSPDGSSISVLNQNAITSSTAALTSSSGSTTPSPSTSAPLRVRFDTEERPIPAHQARNVIAENVTNLCELATSAAPDENRRNYLPVDQHTNSLKASKMQTINSFLCLPMRYNRIWAPKTLNKDSIFLVCGTSATAKPLGPYFSSSSHDIGSTVADAWHGKSSLLLLGVVLLELFHGERLEQQSSWAESLDNGQPNENTRFCSAFLWACRAKKSLKEYFGDELGEELAEAIRKCICFDFGRDDDFGDMRLVELVYKEVVVPLEKCTPM
ncbi:hypothetical protein B0T10DRAFT_532214 [Thelonectria olida]|uniref:DUF7580 domain-containing protein n=1 Tax=Thelonectria olida TaxID=1576542 RepID=A0A9P9AKK4_9HYPO|nr:hypothetical protein B0T10DRAFT_532214 [Thelonectria olida]